MVFYRVNEGTLGDDRLVQLLEEIVVAGDDVLHLVWILGKPGANVAAVTQSCDRLLLIPSRNPNEKELSVSEGGRKKRKHGEDSTLQISVHQRNGRLIRLQQTHLPVSQNNLSKPASGDDLQHTASPTSGDHDSKTTD